MNWKVFAVIGACVLGGTTHVQAGGAGKAPRGMVLIPAGAFWMGSPDGKGNDDEYPRHQVYVDAFYIDKYLVTNRSFQKFVKATGYRTDAETSGGGYTYNGSAWVMNPSANWKDPQGDGKGIGGKMSDPVVQVDWNDATAYAQWAGKRLPTEAEWEKAARGGTTTRYFFGTDAGLLGDYAWYMDNSGDRTHPVGKKKPNPYGLYDILGNVWEWVADWYGWYYAVSPWKNPQGPDSGTLRGLRGGSWILSPIFMRSAARYGKSPADRYGIIGFRCARNP